MSSTRWRVLMVDGSEFEVSTTMGDLVAFELEHTHQAKANSVADLSWLIWRGAKRTGHVAEGLDLVPFMDLVDDWEQVKAAPLVEAGSPSSPSPADPDSPSSS